MSRVLAAPGPRRAGLALALWLAALALGLALIARAPFSADLSAFLPSDPDAEQRLLIQQIEGGVAARMLLIGIDGGDAAARADASRRLAAGLRASGLFEQVQNGERGGRAADDAGPAAAVAAGGGEQDAGRWLFEHRYQLSPSVTPERFGAAGLREAIDETLGLLGTPAGNAFKPLLDRDPTGETLRIAEGLIPAQAPRSEQGVWMARRAPRALLLATVRAPGADLDAQARAIARVRAEFAPLAAPGLALRLSGAPLFAVDSRAAIEAEVKQLAAVGALVMGGLLLLAFASLRAVAVAALPVVTGIVCGVAGVALAFPSVHGLTLAFGSTLIGEAVDYAIYYLIQARGAAAAGPAAAGEGWRAWLAHSWPTVRLGLLTSVAGFAALSFSGFPGLAQLGVFSIAGLAGAAATTRYLLPALVPDGAAGQGLRRHMARLAGAALHALPRLRTPLLVAGALALPALALQWQHLWRAGLGSLSPVPRAAQALDAELRAELGAGDARTLVLASGADREAALQAAEAAAPRLDALVEQGVLAGYETPARVLPSLATQRARQASLPDAATLSAALAEATAGGPLPAARLAPFVDALQAARRQAPLERAALDATPLAPLVDALLLQRPEGGYTALLALQPAGEEVDAARVRAALQGLPGGHRLQVIDIKQQLDALYARYLHEASVQALLGALAVVALLAAWLRSAPRLLAVCQPLALAVLLTLGGLALAGVALGILHLVGLLLVVAVGSNYALFFDQVQQRSLAAGGADDDTLASLLLANLTTVASFGLLALSPIPALSAIGRVVAPGALLALLLAAAFARRRAG